MEFDCLVPFYNEGNRIIDLVKVLVKVRQLKQIICIDDGSTDQVYKKIKEVSSKIVLIRHSKNQGKSQAIFSALSKINTSHILIIDGDLSQVNKFEVSSILKSFSSHPELDQVILRVKGNKHGLIDNILRNYIVQSGIRIIKTQHLKQLVSYHPKNYQLEVAMNKFILDHHLSVAWTPFSAINPHKTTKYNYLSGFIRDIIMDIQIISYLGILGRIKQILFFCRTQLINP